jgi:gluconolactonase
VQIKRLSLGEDPAGVSVVVEDANAANGMVADRRGGLLVCEQGSRSRSARISRLDRATGERETVVDDWRGLRLNSPNDVVVTRNGAIWFTDPSYGHLQGFRPEPQVGDFVYRHDPVTGQTRVVADGFDKPNGIAFSPDERVLYVTDSGAPRHVVAFDVAAPGRLGARRAAFAPTAGEPDGLKADAAGRLYCSSAFGVQVFDPDGTLLGEIRLPGAVNFAFGGTDRDVLFITTDAAVWAAALTTKGA